MNAKKRDTQRGDAEEKLVLRPLGKDGWGDVERLFGSNGACGGCWCMWWRVERGGKTWEAAKGERNRERLQRLVRAGAIDAVIAYAGTEPVGWCSFGPRASFPRLSNSRVLSRDAPPATWSIVCFFIPARWRGRKVASRLLAAASERAFARGAFEVEGFPVPIRTPGTSLPAAFAWTGVPALFEAAGFAPIERAGALRPIYVRSRSKPAPKRRAARLAPKPARTPRPMQPMQPLEPMQPMAPARPLKHPRPARKLPVMKPTEPMLPLGPMKPIEPMRPLRPMKPIPPFAPLSPPKKTRKTARPSKPPSRRSR